MGTQKQTQSGEELCCLLGSWKNGLLDEKNKVGPLLYIIYYIWTAERTKTNLKVIGKTIELIKENVREYFCDLGMGENLNPFLKAQAIKDKLVALQCQN